MTLQAQWEVTASDGGRLDKRIVWATDAGLALIVAKEERGWGATVCEAQCVSDFTEVRDWTQPNTSYLHNGEVWKLTGALRWHDGVLEQEWRGGRNLTWTAVPTVRPGDRV